MHLDISTNLEDTNNFGLENETFVDNILSDLLDCACACFIE